MVVSHGHLRSSVRVNRQRFCALAKHQRLNSSGYQMTKSYVVLTHNPNSGIRPRLDYEWPL